MMARLWSRQQRWNRMDRSRKGDTQHPKWVEYRGSVADRSERNGGAKSVERGVGIFRLGAPNSGDRDRHLEETEDDFAASNWITEW